jgi:hypothetical protein
MRERPQINVSRELLGGCGEWRIDGKYFIPEPLALKLIDLIKWCHEAEDEIDRIAPAEPKDEAREIANRHLRYDGNHLRIGEDGDSILIPCTPITSEMAIDNLVKAIREGIDEGKSEVEYDPYD